MKMVFYLKISLEISLGNTITLNKEIFGGNKISDHFEVDGPVKYLRSVIHPLPLEMVGQLGKIIYQTP